jgi:hypothetical protein
MPLASQHASIRTAQELVNEDRQELQQVLELMRQHNLSGGTDQEYWGRLKKQWDSVAQRQWERIENHAALSEAYSQEMLRAAERAFAIDLELQALTPDILLAVRQEMDLDLNPTTYRQLFVEQKELAQKAMRDFMTSAALASVIPPRNTHE